MQREFVLRLLADLAPDWIVLGETDTVFQTLEKIKKMAGWQGQDHEVIGP